jgi:undecaprenyl-diphosphatase
LLSFWREPAARDYGLKLLTAFALTGLGGVALDKAGFRLPEQVVPVAIALGVGGLLFVLAEWWLRNRTPRDEITWTSAVAVGVGQLIAAVFPGTSRSGATILMMLALGMSRPAATEFSFLVGIPTMLAAGGLKVFKALHHPPPGIAPEHWGMVALGTALSAIVSFMVVKWLLRFVQTHTFTGLGWYRLGLGLLMLAL